VRLIQVWGMTMRQTEAPRPGRRFVSWIVAASLLGTAYAADADVNVWISHGPHAASGRDVVVSLAIDPIIPTTLYAGTDGAGIFKSTDAGGNWIAATSGLVGPPIEGGGYYASGIVNTLVIDPVASNTLYAGTDDGVFKSTDGGGTWEGANTGFPVVNDEIVVSVVDLEIDPRVPSTLYASTWDGESGLFKSTDGSRTWSCLTGGISHFLDANNGIAALIIDPFTPTTLYAVIDEDQGHSYIVKSEDGGATWEYAGSGLPVDDAGYSYITAIAIDPIVPNALYVGSAGIFKSTNGGGNWNKIGAGPPGSPSGGLTYVIDPITPTTIYAATSNGVFKSTDGATSWSVLDTGLSGQPLDGADWGSYVTTLAIDPLAPSALYAGTFGGGVYALQQVTVCGGDCNMDGQVTVDEVLTMVNIALGTVDIAACASGETIHDDQITIDELVAAVQHAMDGCAS